MNKENNIEQIVETMLSMHEILENNNIRAEGYDYEVSTIDDTEIFLRNNSSGLVSVYSVSDMKYIDDYSISKSFIIYRKSDINKTKPILLVTSKSYYYYTIYTNINVKRSNDKMFKLLSNLKRGCYLDENEFKELLDSLFNIDYYNNKILAQETNVYINDTDRVVVKEDYNNTFRVTSSKNNREIFSFNNIDSSKLIYGLYNYKNEFKNVLLYIYNNSCVTKYYIFTNLAVSDSYEKFVKDCKCFEYDDDLKK